MFRREHNLQYYAKDQDSSHWISFRDFARWIAFDEYQNKNKHFRKGVDNTVVDPSQDQVFDLF